MIPLDSPWNALLAASLRGSALILCVLAVRGLLRGRLPAQAVHLLWLLVAVRLVMPAAPSSSWSVFNLVDRAPAGVVAADAGWEVRSFVEPSAVVPKTVVGAAVTLPKQEWRAADVLPWVWAIGVTVQAALLGWSALAMRRRLRRGAVIEDARFLRLAGECREQLGLRRQVAFLESAELAGPAVVVLWQPRLVMPPGLIACLSDEELRFVLLHELAHVRRHDLAALWLLTAARVLHWFNPLAWLAAHVARGDAELACDETVLRHARGTVPVAYGAALLKLVQLAPWRPTAVPMAGIAERTGALKERLARIADYAPGTVRRTAFTALVVLGVGMVFGADEKKDTAPAPAPQAAEPQAAPEVAKIAEKVAGELPAWAKGWSVVKVVIPADGEIKNAFVDLLQPDGKTVTLYPGQQTKERVMLSGVGLIWSPARAQVRLRNGKETTALFADAALISKSETLKRETGQVEIEARFIEVPDSLALEFKDSAGKPIFWQGRAIKGAKPMRPHLGQISHVLTEPEKQRFVNELQKTKGVDLLSAPRVTTKSGQRAVIEIIREFRYPTEWKPDEEKKGTWLPTVFETRNVGVTLEVEPTLGEGKVLDLLLTPQVVEHLGYVDVETGKPVKSSPSNPNVRGASARKSSILQPLSPAAIDSTIFERGARTNILQPLSHGSGRIRPVFSTRKVTTSISIFSGNSVVIDNIGETEETKPFKPKTPGRRLIVIITARQLTYSGEEMTQPR